MKPERIAELRELCDKATPGEWEKKYDTNLVYAGRLVANAGGYSDSARTRETRLQNDANAAFIAAARTAVPELLDELERLRGILRGLEYYHQTKTRVECYCCGVEDWGHDLQHYDDCAWVIAMKEADND